MWDKIKNLLSNTNKYGLAIPTIRDPKMGIGSVSLTLLFISSVTVIVGLVGKWSGKFGGIDMANALQFFGICYAGYLGRKLQSDGKKIELSGEEPPKAP